MISRMGLHKVAAFYCGLFVVGVVLGKLADVPNVFTTHILSTEEALLRLGGGLLAGALIAGMSGLASRMFEGARAMDASLAELLGPIAFDEALILAGLSGIAEEVLFRGAIQSLAGIVVASALFMLAHLPPKKDLTPWTLSAGIAGIVLGGMTMWTGDIVAAIAAHFMVNAIGLSRLGKQAA